jgi:hypothetical protein
VAPGIDGFWTAEFGSNEGMFGGGVVIFQDGKVVGGDATHFYIGEYSAQETSFQATLKVSAFIPGAESVFRTVGSDLTLDLVGSMVSETQAIAQGAVRGAPSFTFGARLTKRDLPPEARKP